MLVLKVDNDKSFLANQSYTPYPTKNLVGKYQMNHHTLKIST